MYQDIADYVAPNWHRDREIAVLAGIYRQKQKGKIRKATTLTAAAAILTIGVFSFFHFGHGSKNAEHRAAVLTQKTQRGRLLQPIEMKDGSTATPMDEGSHLIISDMTDNHMSVRVEKGGGNFNVVPNKGRVFEVTMNDVTITVVGTAFRVQQEGDRARVVVTRGHVRVGWPGGESDLFGGQEGIFPPVTASAAFDTEKTTLIKKNKKVRKTNTGRAWRSMARSGDYAGASTILSKGADVRDTVDDLLLAADAMRLSGKPGKALPYLMRVSKDHADDPRASLAEFTRGRILLFQMNKPAIAAEAFATARQLSPGSSLAQDALAREVEALHKSGNHSLSKIRAEEYIRRYPKGRRLDAVQRYGNISP